MEEAILNNICSYKLDFQQKEIVLSEDESLLVVAGAGSGKSLTIIGKIRYLIEKKEVKDSEILCISFTNDSANSLKQKIYDNYKYNIDVFTFHKLSLEVLKNNNVSYKICSSDYLEFIIDEFFSSIIFNYPNVIKQVLKYFKVRINKNIYKQYKKIYYANNNEILILKNLIAKFIHLFKSNGYKLEKFIEFDRKIFFGKKKNLIKIILNIYLYYFDELSSDGRIDFDDMISLATNCIKGNGKIKKYKYIIIDEYQDTSYLRYLLIRSIIDKTKARFMAVGDDFQSIYRFTGCDLNIFIKFNEYFPNSKLLKIENTYRNSQELIDVIGNFVMKNNAQIKKKLKSSKNADIPIKIIYYKDKILYLKNIIMKLKGNIMILGRNNNDINHYIDSEYEIKNNGKIIFKKDLSINIRYLTIHKAKGLEADNVIIINMINDKFGFPNKIRNNSILKFVTYNKDRYLYEEERRLFYVALTRTKNNVYLFTETRKESIFIKELIRNYKNRIEIKKET